MRDADVSMDNKFIYNHTFIWIIYREASVQERNNTLLVWMSLKQEKNNK